LAISKPTTFGLCKLLKEEKEREKRDLNYWRKEKITKLRYDHLQTTLFELYDF